MYAELPYSPGGASAHSAAASAGAGSESSLRLDRQFKLASSRADMEKERVKAEVYALLQTTDRLEALYGRGAISKDDVSRRARVAALRNARGTSPPCTPSATPCRTPRSPVRVPAV